MSKRPQSFAAYDDSVFRCIIDMSSLKFFFLILLSCASGSDTPCRTSRKVQ